MSRKPSLSERLLARVERQLREAGGIDGWRPLCHIRDELAWQRLAAMLDESGIPWRVHNEATHRLFPGLPLGPHNQRMALVPADHWPEAADALDDLLRHLDPEPLGLELGDRTDSSRARLRLIANGEEER